MAETSPTDVANNNAITGKSVLGLNEESIWLFFYLI